MALPVEDPLHQLDVKVPTSRVLYWRIGVFLAIVLIGFWHLGLALVLATVAMVWSTSGEIDLAESAGHDPRHLP